MASCAGLGGEGREARRGDGGLGAWDLGRRRTQGEAGAPHLGGYAFPSVKGS